MQTNYGTTGSKYEILSHNVTCCKLKPINAAFIISTINSHLPNILQLISITFLYLLLTNNIFCKCNVIYTSADSPILLDLGIKWSKIDKISIFSNIVLIHAKSNVDFKSVLILTISAILFEI